MRNHNKGRVPGKIIACMLAASIGLAGCGAASESLPADQFLSLSISGLAGIDQYTFEGKSGIVLPVGVTVGSVSYKGEVTDHANMTVQMTGNGDGGGGTSGVGVMSEDGDWKLLARRGADRWLPANAGNGMRTLNASSSWSESTWAGINPLERLERLKDAAKSVAYGGTDGNDRHRVIQIVLEPSAAKQEWRHRIETEWESVAGGRTVQTAASGRDEWSIAYEKSGKQLAAMLDSLEAETRIEITADSRTMLPLKVVEHSTLRFQANGKERQESHSGTVTFTG
ncbi:hypothetical protein [Paenibacillus kobensis]|uniref:hypothetical protein n=1 Tax=Paenibacillus kobensis TaxID=59841 RepID=UPI000FD7981D|nr:hypothetical protein [Paenibacillus kobensis]